MSLRARQNQTDFRYLHEFKRDAEDHLDWTSRHETPFISTFASRQHAVNWALDRRESGCGTAVVLKLDTQRLGPIFCVRHLVKHPRLQLYTELPEHTYRDEYLVLNEIPSTSILCEIDPRDIGRGQVQETYDSDGGDYSDSSDSDDSDMNYWYGHLKRP
ncbi:hypothetical protein PHMEG_00021543 [Phytophthora megakarya]|uniref:DUF7587 domain-containing protein n=1 Tax=Phytophthora megakarya TaxID=4795 RepID=A0A225VLL9_9STRA|nr:hypothetical protein PHMEG_00021543 [Phytophthora megakarya]